jgi:AraC family transcriptional regulator
MTNRLGPGVFHGDKIRQCELGNFTLTEYEFAANRFIPRHCHERTYLSFVLEGGWYESYGSKARDRRPSTLTVHPAGEIHSERLDRQGARAFHVEFSLQWLDRLDRYAAVLARPAQIEGGPLTWHALRLHAEFRQNDPHSSMVIEGILLESVAELARSFSDASESASPTWLSKVRDLLHARFAESLSLPSIAREINVHPVHLARAFRRRYRCTVGVYLRQVRVRHACHELITSDCPISEIAAASGFFDQSHLSRVIRRWTGLSPSALRRNGRR